MALEAVCRLRAEGIPCRVLSYSIFPLREAADTLLSSLVSQGQVSAGAAGAIRGDINAAYRAVHDPND